LKRLVHGCKRLLGKHSKLIISEDDVVSDNFYGALSADQLRREFNKTLNEKRKIEQELKGLAGKKGLGDL
jgi:hypothetical protein